MDFVRWLYPGLKVKRWICIILMGILLMMLGLIILLGPTNLAALSQRSLITIGELLGSYSPYNGLFFLAVGGIFSWYGFKKTIYSVLSAVVPEEEEKLLELLNRRRQKNTGPKVVALGGGTGLPNLLRGLKPYTGNITAVVTVSDDGGSSGKLRGELGMIPPGDVRNCLLALADAEPLMSEIFDYRFTSGEELKGHNVGNLIIAALNNKHGFKDSLASISKVLAVKGKVLPITDKLLTLKARFTDGSEVTGESSISNRTDPIEQLYLEEQDTEPLPEVLQAIKDADAVILGPGSLYTSVLPNLLVPGIAREIKKSQATKIYVTNIMTQPGETDNFTASDHLKTIEKHVGKGIVDTVVVNDDLEAKQDILDKYLKEGQKPVELDWDELKKLDVQIINKNFNRRDSLIRHDSNFLGKTIIKELLKN